MLHSITYASIIKLSIFDQIDINFNTLSKKVKQIRKIKELDKFRWLIFMPQSNYSNGS